MSLIRGFEIASTDAEFPQQQTARDVYTVIPFQILDSVL